MSSPVAPQIEERLHLLENRLRRWRLVTLLLVSVAAVCLVTGAGQFRQYSPPAGAPALVKHLESKEIVSATQFRLVDENGTIRAVLGAIKGGRVGLYLFDENGERKTTLDETSLLVVDKEGNTATLALVDGTPIVGLSKLFGRGARLRLEPK
jgi:hypothetical protein